MYLPVVEIGTDHIERNDLPLVLGDSHIASSTQHCLSIILKQPRD